MKKSKCLQREPDTLASFTLQRHHRPTTMMRFLLVAACAATLFLTTLLEETDAFAIVTSRISRHYLQTEPAFAADARPLQMSNNKDDDDDEDMEETTASPSSTNVLGTTLMPCCTNVRDTGIGTGFYRNGFCSTGEADVGRHTVCVQVTDDFLEFSKSVGNDLSTPAPQYMFPGLKEGDIWCLCAQRWAQAYNAGKAPKLFLAATHEKTLDHVPFTILRKYALDKEEADDALDDLNKQRERLNKLL